MNAKFEALAQKNVDHYNAHPVQHTAIAVSYLVVGVWMVRRINKRMAKTDAQLRSGQYAQF